MEGAKFSDFRLCVSKTFSPRLHKIGLDSISKTSLNYSTYITQPSPDPFLDVTQLLHCTILELFSDECARSGGHSYHTVPLSTAQACAVYHYVDEQEHTGVI